MTWASLISGIHAAGGGLWFVLALAAAVAVAALQSLVRVHRGHQRVPLLADQRATASLEFCLVLPMVMFMVLILAQTTLVMAGNMYVHYAAFAATRSAIVQLPLDYGGVDDGYNTISNDRGNPKLEVIRRAAAMALIPVSGRAESGNIPASAIKDGVVSYYNGYGKPRPNWLSPTTATSSKFKSYSISSLEAAANYAEQNTDVYVMETVVADDDQGVEFWRLEEPKTFGPKDPVTVQVSHRLYLAVPYVRWIFSDVLVNSGTYTTRYGATAKSFEHDHESPQHTYRTITAQSTLTNEGIRVALPDPTPIPRRP